MQEMACLVTSKLVSGTVLVVGSVPHLRDMGRLERGFFAKVKRENSMASALVRSSMWKAALGTLADVFRTGSLQ